MSTGAASGVSQNSATIAGQVNPNGLATTYEFEYGTSTKYGSATATGSVGAGTTITRVSVTLNGLSSGTTYHYRLLATNADGTSYGADRTFKTTPRLTVGLHRLARSYRVSSGAVCR